MAGEVSAPAGVTVKNQGSEAVCLAKPSPLPTPGPSAPAHSSNGKGRTWPSCISSSSGPFLNERSGVPEVRDGAHGAQQGQTPSTEHVGDSMGSSPCLSIPHGQPCPGC